MAARGIKTKIAINVALLLLLSAVITDILVVTVMQSVMVRDEISRSRGHIVNIGHLFLSSNFQQSTSKSNPKHMASRLLDSDLLPVIIIADSNGRILYRKSSVNHSAASLEYEIKAARNAKTDSIKELSHRWVLFWWHPGAISITVPIQYGGQLNGVAGAVIPLNPIYQKLKKYHNPIFLYILINTAVLTVVGLYRIFRLYLRPIDRIIHQADGFHEDGDLFFAFRHEDNELNRLSSALNRMLTKISSDKQQLQATVSSLERANRELQNAQKEIIRAEKMASIGRLAAGIAHEIGNPIGIVLGYVDMLKQQGLDEEDKADFLQRTEAEVQRINTVIRQLLDLARPKKTRNENVSVNAVITDIVEVMQLQPVMSDISITLELQAADDAVQCNGDQLRQVFLNLLLNAADSIQSCESGDGGHIRVQTSNEESSDSKSTALLNVRFEDTGAGIPTEQLQNIFDPFYTTKEPGKGTGLGLAVSYMIVDGIGGTIRAESELGRGAVFILALPVFGS